MQEFGARSWGFAAVLVCNRHLEIPGTYWYVSPNRQVRIGSTSPSSLIDILMIFG